MKKRWQDDAKGRKGMGREERKGIAGIEGNDKMEGMNEWRKATSKRDNWTNGDGRWREGND